MNSYKTSSRLAVLALFFLNGTLLSSWIPHIPLVQQRFGLSEGVLGAALFSMAVGAVVSMSASGSVIQRFGSKKVTIWSAVAFCLSMPLPVLAPSFPALIVVLFLFGACNGSMDVAMNAQAVIVEKQYGRPIMSSFHGFFSIGGLLGASIGGVALANGVSPLIHVLTVSGVLFPIILLSFRHLAHTKNETAAPKEKIRLKPNGRLLGLGVLAFLVLVAEGSVADWSGVYIKQTLQSGPGFVAAGYASFSLMMAVGRLMGDRFVANIGPVPLTRRTSLLAASGLATVLLLPHPISIVLGFGCVGLGLSNLIPVLFSSAGSIPGVPAGKGIAVVATAGYFGFLAGPPVIGVLAEMTTLNVALFSVVGSIFIVTLLANLTRHSGTCKQSNVCTTKVNKTELKLGGRL